MECVRDIIVSAAGPFFQVLIPSVKEHMGYLISSTTYVSDMNSKMRVLDGKRVDVEKRMKENNLYDLEIPNRMPNWVKEVQKINEDAVSLSNNGNGFFDLQMRYRAGKNASMIVQEIDRLIKEESETKWTDRQKPLGKVNSERASTSRSSSDDTQNDFKSRNQTFSDALKFLQPNDNTQIIALCGMGGVGKTTTMEQLEKVVKGNNTFDYILKAVIGQKSDPIAIQQAVADYIGEPLTVTTKTARADRLCNIFENMSKDQKKILVILDDVWDILDLNDIGLSRVPNGFKLFLTSRDEEVCRQMAVAANLYFKVVRVDVLEEQEAHDFFCRIAGVSKESDPELSEIGGNIVKRCGFLPLAIKVIARTLNSKKKFLWSDTLRRLKKNDFDGNVREIIDISYNHRKDEEKAIFLLCGLFPDDFDIPIEELTRYAWGLQLLDDVPTLGDARNKTKTCVDNLRNANLLLASHHLGCVKMHDLVLSFVLDVISKAEHASFINHGNLSNRNAAKMSEACKRISLTCSGMSKLPGDFRFPYLSALKLRLGDESLMLPEDFYERMESLQLIAFEKIQYPLLPGSLQCSTKLRTLCLNSCLLMDDFSRIGNLMNLEVLSFAGCRIRKLPSPIGKLKKLKLLDVTECVNLVIDNGVLGNLGHLEELYMKVVYGEPIRFTDTNCNELGELSKKLFALEVEFFNNKAEPKNVFFEDLERFRISIGCYLNPTWDDSFENTLMLVSNKAELLECGINQLFPKTEVLHLNGVGGMNNIEDILAKRPPRHSFFYDLRVLHVSECADLRYLFTLRVVESLSKLERLTISSCSALEELIYVTGAMSIRFQNLKLLSLNELPTLVSLCRNADLELPELVELTLEGLPNFTCIYPMNKSTIPLSDDISSMQSVLNKVAVPKLEILQIERMAKLKEMCPCQFRSCEDENICRLREIEVAGCDSLVNLFPTNPMSWLHHLEEVVIRDCGSIEVIFDLDLGCVHEIMEGSSSLRRIEVDFLGKLREVWRMKGVNDTHHINGFQAVTHIKISSCESFRNVFTPTNANFNLEALESIYVLGCGHLGESGRKNGLMESSTDTPCQVINVASMGETSGGVDDDNVAFPSHLIPTFHHVGEIYLSQRKGVEVVFEMESPSSIGGRELGTIHNNQLLLPHLKNLYLDDMERMSHVWKCNWNKFLIPQPLESPFHNLTNIELQVCKSIKYLFSPLMARLLSNLKEVRIFYCTDMEEVVSNRDDEDEEMPTSTFTHTNTAFFPQLDSLFLDRLPRLKHIGGGRAGGWSNEITSNINAIGTSIHNEFQVDQAHVVSWSLCQYSRKIYIEICDALTSVIPSHAIGPLKKLELLKIYYCKSMVEVFGTNRVNNDSIYFDERSCGSSTAVTIPRLKNMPLLELPNLKILKIGCCGQLGHVFTYSTLESLKQLEELKIEHCKAMQVIVKEEVGEQTTPKVVDFPRLKSLELVNLPNLSGFFLGMNDFQWPLLDMVKIVGCPQMMVFTRGHSTTPKLNYIHTSLGKYSLECGLNFQMTTPNASQETQFHSSSVCSTSDSIKLLQLPWSLSNLIEVDVQGFEQRIIFPCNELLKLQNLEKLQVGACMFSSIEEVFEVVEGTNDDVNETQSVVTFPKLKEVTVHRLKNLRYIWKSNQWTVLEFPNLTRVSIDNCGSLDHLFTWSMVGSLPQLQELYISYCEEMKVIVKEANIVREEEEESDAKTNEIVFPCLKSLKLDYLPNLKGFCSEKEDFLWSSLNTLEIMGCERLEHVFTCSMVGSLSQLQELHISYCKKMEVIVKEANIVLEEEETEAKTNEIVFPCLKSLKLDYLPSLKGFCLEKEDFQWPSLDTLEIKDCPEITVFTNGESTTPELKVIDTSFGRCYAKEDLNSFIKTKKQEGFSFGGEDEDDW